MIINNSIDLIKVIQFLIPNARCSVWETTDITKYHGETSPILRLNMLIDWHEKQECPSEKDLLSVDENAMYIYYENIRKQQRDNKYKEDYAMIANFNIWLISNPSGTFSQYLDMIETIQQTLKSKLV
jgi:hypothetical protein